MAYYRDVDSFLESAGEQANLVCMRRVMIYEAAMSRLIRDGS